MKFETLRILLRFLHRTGIKHRAADALSQLNTTSQDEVPLEDDLALYTIDNTDNQHGSVHAVAHKEDHALNVPYNSPFNDKTDCDLTTTVKILRAQ